MKNKTKKLVIPVLSILILIASLAVMLCDIFIPLNFWTHPVLNFLFCLAIGYGVICISLGFIKTSAWYFFISAVLFGLALVYALMQYITWWIGLIIVGVILVIFAILSIISNGSKTEDIAINKSPDYKNYFQRKEEKEKQEAETQPEKLPEIKSFK
ncbi:MAG: hypothetical protein E7347_03345 [Clostridiales bacterium]|nr:hypothetical protein [Clostridiales bacterium]